MHGTVRYCSRREALALGCMAAGLGLLAPLATGAAVTPNTTLGPFYPMLKPLDSDADLTRIAGRTGRAKGELLELVGRVLDRDGASVPGASVEIWQADSRGRYTHPHDPNPAAPDTDFQGYGLQRTDDQGRYRFRTVKPAAYSFDGGMRTPHVHFQITSPRERKVTQMFFPGEPLNEQDQILRAVPRDPARLIARIDASAPGVEPGAKLVTFDIVLMRG